MMYEDDKKKKKKKKNESGTRQKDSSGNITPTDKSYTVGDNFSDVASAKSMAKKISLKDNSITTVISKANSAGCKMHIKYQAGKVLSKKKVCPTKK